jgi:hypothetical protein
VRWAILESEGQISFIPRGGARVAPAPRDEVVSG